MSAADDPAEEERVSGDDLIEQARRARHRAYAPYSGFTVGAALRAVDGRVVTGVNVENASSPAGICAERAALATAIGQGLRDFDAIAVAGTGSEPCVPCGTCRQMLTEHAPSLRVLAAGESGEAVAYRLDRDLLPRPFRR